MALRLYHSNELDELSLRFSQKQIKLENPQTRVPRWMKDCATVCGTITESMVENVEIEGDQFQSGNEASIQVDIEPDGKSAVDLIHVAPQVRLLDFWAFYFLRWQRDWSTTIPEFFRYTFDSQSLSDSQKPKNKSRIAKIPQFFREKAWNSTIYRTESEASKESDQVSCLKTERMSTETVSVVSSSELTTLYFTSDPIFEEPLLDSASDYEDRNAGLNKSPLHDANQTDTICHMVFAPHFAMVLLHLDC